MCSDGTWSPEKRPLRAGILTPEEEVPVANAVFLSGHTEVGSKSVEGQQTRTTCAAGTSSCWRVKSVAGATLIGAGSKQRRKSPFPPPTRKFPMASLIGRA